MNYVIFIKNSIIPFLIQNLDLPIEVINSLELIQMSNSTITSRNKLNSAGKEDRRIPHTFLTSNHKGHLGSPNISIMKILMILMIALTFSSELLAQEKMDKTMKMDSKAQTDHAKDHLMMKDGKMLMIIGGKTTAMDKDMKLTNGTLVKVDGTMKTKDGMTMKMKDGDMIYMDGKMGKMESVKPKAPNRSQHHHH